MKIGDQCTIWDGESPIDVPSSWLFGVVVKKKTDRKIGKEMYQVIWSDGDRDSTWYDFNDIKMEMWKEGGER
jgi:hypothetical protein